MSSTTITEPASETPKAGKRKRPVLILLLLLLAGGAAGWWFFLRPAQGEEAPVPGAMVALEPIQLNLADNRYLRIGLALETIEGSEEPDGSKALDAAIEIFSGQSVAALAINKRRERLKQTLSDELEELYEGEVIAVYYTDFVTQ